MSAFPIQFAEDGWFTTSFIASRLGVAHRTVQYWCKNGFFLKRGCKVIATTGGSTNLRGSRYWVRIPLLSRDAMLRKIPIDNSSLSTITSKP